MFITSEYSRLYGIECDDVVLLPNKPFCAFKGNYKVGSYARILNADGKEVMKLSAGETINGIGILSKPAKDYSTDEVKETAKNTVTKRRTRKKKEVKDGIKL